MSCIGDIYIVCSKACHVKVTWKRMEIGLLLNKVVVRVKKGVKGMESKVVVGHS